MQKPVFRGVWTCGFGLLLAVYLTSSAYGETITWLANPVSSDWNTAANWNPSVIPNAPGDIARFVTSSTPGIGISSDTGVGGVTFESAQTSFTISVPPVLTLTLTGVGITNNSKAIQNLRAFPGVGATSSGTIRFQNSATAGNNVAIINAGPNTTSGSGGRTLFLNDASAGAASIRNEAPSNGATGAGGSTTFSGSANAGSARIINLGGQANGAGSGNTYFLDSSSAGNAFFSGSGASPSNPAFTTFTNNSTAQNAVFMNSGSFGPHGAGVTTFFGVNSTAAAARLVATGGANLGRGGSFRFSGDSSGGTSRVELSGNGELDISGHALPGVTIGSLTGGTSVGDGGQVFLGRNSLGIGSNGMSTVFSGIFLDGGASGGTGGSLSKVGEGSLTLAMSSSYTGGARINEGTVLVTNTSGSATGTGFVRVNSTLGGTGRIGGPVAVNAGGALLPGNGTTATGSLTLSNNLTLDAGAMIEIVAGPGGSHSTLARAGGTWTFAPNQEFTILDVGLQPGLYDNIITGLASNPGTTATWRIANSNISGTFVYDGSGNVDLNVTSVGPAGLEMTQVVSRAAHAAEGSFSIRLPLVGPPGIDCRDAGGAFVLVFTFNSIVVSGNASVVGGIGNVSSPPTFSGNTMIVRLTGVANAQRLTVSLDNVTSVASLVMPSSQITVGFLVGDTNRNGVVNASDVGQTKSFAGQSANPTNFTTDVNVSGSINASDIALVKSDTGTSLP